MREVGALEIQGALGHRGRLQQGAAQGEGERALQVLGLGLGPVKALDHLAQGRWCLPCQWQGEEKTGGGTSEHQASWSEVVARVMGFRWWARCSVTALPLSTSSAAKRARSGWLLDSLRWARTSCRRRGPMARPSSSAMAALLR